MFVSPSPEENKPFKSAMESFGINDDGLGSPKASGKPGLPRAESGVSLVPDSAYATFSKRGSLQLENAAAVSENVTEEKEEEDLYVETRRY